MKLPTGISAGLWLRVYSFKSVAENSRRRNPYWIWSGGSIPSPKWCPINQSLSLV